jgi:hypothetical protein
VARPTSEEIFEKSEEILLIKLSPAFDDFCGDLRWLAISDDYDTLEPKKFFNQVRKNYPEWEQPDFLALYFMITGEVPDEK